MIRDLFTFFIGTYKISVKTEDRLRAINLMHQNGLSCRRVKVLPNGDYTFSVTAFAFDKLSVLFQNNCIDYTHSEIKGFPRAVIFMAKRPGIVVGCLLFFALMWFSSRTIWSMDITGNLTVPDSEILTLLDELGCGYGDYIPGIDFDMLHARFISKSENISWISVNLKGNHANIEVLEVKPGDTFSAEEGVYANLVAREDAEIFLVKTVSGASSVTPGTIVKKGELLVSGVVSVREDRVRYEYASGEVLAYVPRTIEVKIPFETSEKVYTGNIKEKKTIKILKKQINLFTKGGIEYTIYDKIIDNRQIILFGRFPLPVWSETSIYKEYEYEKIQNEYEKTVSLAMSELRDRLDETLEDAELVSNKVTTEITEDSFVIRYDMVCLTDIAEVCEFTVEDLGDTNS